MSENETAEQIDTFGQIRGTVGMVRRPNPDTAPTPGDPCGPCPYCGRVSNFELVAATYPLAPQVAERRTLGPSTYPPTTNEASMLRCRGCNAVTLVVTNGRGIEEEIVHVFPTPGALTLGDGVHPKIASAYAEGLRCLSIGANRAAAVMFRGALHLFVKDKGDEQAKQEKHLKPALKLMSGSGTLHPSLADWAGHLNQLGNEGAHPEDYDEVTAEEAQELSRFVFQLIDLEYLAPARLRRARGRNSEPK